MIEKMKKNMKLNTQRTSGGSGGQPAAARQAWHTLNPKSNPNHCKAPTLGFTRIEGRALESAAGVFFPGQSLLPS